MARVRVESIEGDGLNNSIPDVRRKDIIYNSDQTHKPEDSYHD